MKIVNFGQTTINQVAGFSGLPYPATLHIGTIRVFTLLDAGPDGLAKDEANLRLGKYGPNRLPDVSTHGP